MLNNAPRTFARTIRGLGALVVSLILAAAMLSVPAAAPEANAATDTAATSDGVNFGDCDFRIGTGAAESWANQICWLDMRGLDQSGKITKRIGQYTLTADVTVEKNRWNNNRNREATFTAQSEQAWSEAAFGRRGFFQKDPASTQQDILKMRGGWARIKLSNIKFVDSSGAPVSNARLMLADAEATGSGGPGEWISASASSGVQLLDSIKSPFSNNGTCQSRYGAGFEPSDNRWTDHTPLQRDFVCWDNRGSGNRGMFVAAMDNPTWAEISIGVYDYGYQAIALGVALGHVQFAGAGAGADAATDAATRASVKSSFEQAATGKASTANYSAALRQGTTETPLEIPAGGGFTTFMRQLGAGGVPQDEIVFRSTMTTDGANPFDRYEPEWTCVAKTDGSPIVTKLRSGSADGLTVTNNRQTGTSEIVTKNLDNRELNCTVSWESKFQPATLELSKQLEGTAKDFAEMNERKFVINYRCDDIRGFNTAYPGRLSGSRTFTRGQSAAIQGLPQGAACTVWETFNPGDVPVLPGKTLKLGWGANGADSAATYSQAGTNGIATPSLRITLGATNNAAAHNVYDLKPGTLHLTKEILGEPVREAYGSGAAKLPNPVYKFRIRCDTTQFDVEKQLPLAPRTDASGATVVDGTIDITGIPTERPCTVTPLTDLSDEQQSYIRFDGRVVRVDNAGSNPVEPGGLQQKAYPFRLPENAPETTMRIKTSYSYVTRDLAVQKLLTGEGGASPELDGKEFTVNYRCERTGSYDAAKQLYIPQINPVEGTVRVSKDDRAVVQGLKVGAECKVWEDETALPQTTYIKFDGATVSANNASDATTSLRNAEARTTPVLTIRRTGDTEQNLVTVANSYSAQLGAVLVAKRVDNKAPDFTPPSTYTVTARCGQRNLTENGSPRPYELVGTAVVSANGTAAVVADDPKLNVGGRMAVPYGNQCTFEEETPEHPAGVAWENSGTDPVTVGAAEITATITNTFTPRGSGLTVTQVLQGEQQLAPADGVDYRLTCTDPAQGAPQTREFTLSADQETQTFDANFAPWGSECVLERVSEENGEREASGKTFPIDHAESFRYAVDDQGQGDLDAAERFTVGTTSAVTVTQAYNLVNAPLNAHKHVVFNEAYPGGPTYISDPRKNVKLHRQFPVSLICTDPLGRERVRVETTVSANQDPRADVDEYDGGADIDTIVPVGSTCAVEERHTTTATGISLDRRITFNGAQIPGAVAGRENDGTVGGSFEVGSGENAVVFNNAYTRRTTEVTVTKIADLPASLRQSVSPEELQRDLYDHQITMVCRDPEAKDEDGNEVPLEEAEPGLIHGEGSYTFTNVPVGADCEFTGTNFGSLRLAAGGLSAYLRPQYVSWSSLGGGGNVTTDTELRGEVASSPLFATYDDPQRNKVGLENHYRYELAPVTLTKDVVGDAADIELLQAGETQFNFSMTCRALGYESSSIGGQRNAIGYGYTKASGEAYVLPRTVAWGTAQGQFARQADQGGKQVWRYTSPAALVPAGAECSFTEQNPTGVDAVLDVAPRERTVDKQVAAPAQAPAEPAVTDMAFVNDATRRTAPVRFVAYETGYVQGQDSPYTGEVRCIYGQGAKETKTYRVDIQRGAVGVGSLPTSEAAPTGGVQLDLPMGADCTVDYGDAPALAARPEIEVTGAEGAKDRRPYVQFATWASGRRDGPATSVGAVAPQDVREKGYTRAFTVAQASNSSGTALVVGLEAAHPRATLNVVVNKAAEGGRAANATFRFSQTCSANEPDFELQSGGTHVIEGIYVDSSCAITETDDGDAEVDSVLDVTGQGSRIAGVEVSQASTGEQIARQRVKFTAQPVAAATDLSVQDQRLWRLDLRNRFPSLTVRKTIDGTSLGGVTLLPSSVDAMRVTYTVHNDGAFALEGLSLADASLGTRTLTPVLDGQPAGTPVAVGPDGAIPAGVCAVPDELAPGGEYTCTFDVDISGEPKDQNFRYPAGGGDAPVVVTAAMQGTGGQQISASDSQGALRPSGVLGWLLPESGQQTMVLILVLGLLLFAAGAWRVTRRSGADRAEGGELVEV